MKLSAFLLFVTIFNLFGGTTYSQNARLNLDMKDVPIQAVLAAIEDQSEFFFLYSSKMIDINQKVNINVTDKKINEVLDAILANTEIKYAVKDRQILLVNKEAEAAMDLQQNKVAGIVTHKDGTPMPGVNVTVTGTTKGVLTDSEGKYSIDVPKGSKSLKFSFIGMESQEINIGTLTQINVTLAEAQIGLQEVVVIGYGTQRKVDLTGSVSVVSVKDFEKAPVTDALNAMQGKVAGVSITSNSGEPGSSKLIRIRGVQSWGASTEPLYVIDGVIMDNMNSLSPNDVESISILKDAASSAIYGARAANGVVLITTKRGSKSGTPVISFEAYAGVQNFSDRKPKLLNSTQWLMLDKESYSNAGAAAWDQSPYGSQPVDMNLFKDAKGNLINTNWLKECGQPGRIQNYDLSVSGGNERSTYYTSVTAFKQDGLILNQSADRISFRLNSDHKVTNFIEFGNSVNIYSHSLHGMSVYEGAIRKNPLSRPYQTDANGKIINYDYVRCYTMEGGDVGPLILAKEYGWDGRAYGFVGNVFLKVKLLQGLTFTPRLSIDYSNNQSTTFVPELHLLAVETQSINHVYKSQDYNFHWTADYMLNYERTFNSAHNVSALLVYSQEENKFEFLNGTRFGTPNNQIRFLNAGQLANQSVYNGFQDWSFVSYIGRIGYNYNEKYFVQASVRRDGTSRFVGKNRWGVFPSASAGWRISKEGFFAPLINVISDFKIRGSFGTLGNSNVGLYPTYATLEMHTAAMGGPSDGSQYASPSYALGAAVNSNIKWEQTQKTDVGFDASFLRSKITLSFDYYYSHTTNLLYGKPIPLSAGKYFDAGGWIDPSDPTINGGGIQNQGVELTLGYQDTKGSFTWGVNGYFSVDRNKVLDLNGRDLKEFGLAVGQPIYSFYGYTSNGIVKTQADIDSHPYLKDPGNDFKIGLGDIWTVDVNGRDANGKLTGKPDGKITADDKGFIGKKYPNFSYGINGNVTWKRWTLQVVTYGIQGFTLNTMMDANGWFQYTSNDMTRALDAWEPTRNPNGNMPKVTKSDVAHNTQNMASFWLSDASFWKINNVNLRYAIPDNICQKLRMRGLEVYTSVENLHTFTKYPGAEVDATDQGQWAQPQTKMPQPRTWVLGLKVSF